MTKRKFAFRSSLAICTFFIVTNGYSQFVKDYKRNADNFYAKGDYYSAAIYYEKYLGGGDKGKDGSTEPYTIQKKGTVKTAEGTADETQQEVVYRVAESYRLLNDYANAEKWYAQALGFDKTKYPDAPYHYGVSLRANGKYAEAQQQFENYLSAKQHAFADQAKLELADVKFIREQLAGNAAASTKVEKYASGINSEGANYAAAWSGNTLYFTSTRPDSALLAGKKKSPFVNALYKMEQGSSVEKVAVPAAQMEQGVASITPDGKRLFFTRWVSKQGQNLAAIYMSDRSAGAWSEPVKVNGVSADEYSSQQPFVTADGKYLLFASNRPGGSGKFDIWYAPLSASGEVGKPVNAGKTINTKEDDQAPYYHQAPATLVFASKGRVGMGGFDLYQSKGSIGGSFEEPQNLGYPVNSNKDDIYFTTAGTGQLLKSATISSDRASACCLELFTVNKTYKKYIAGSITDCKTNEPISADVRLSVPSKMLSSVNGRFIYEVDQLTSTQITATKNQYRDTSASLSPSNVDVDTLYTSFCLAAVETVPEVPVVTPQPVTPKLALFDFDMYKLRHETETVLDTIAALLVRESMLGVEIVGHTDAKGTEGYNLKLSELRALECKNYLLKKGVAEDRIKTTALGESEPLQAEKTETGKDDPKARQANRRVDFKIYLR
jgi:OmpA-OmpF porin, OOP family